MADGQVSGTKFRLFPQSPSMDKASKPETVYVSSPVGSLTPGPSDERMYTVYPIGKQTHYGMHENEQGEPLLFLPPWNAATHTPATSAADGHFDHLEPGTREFEAAHLFGSARFVLDVWERYFDRKIEWHFKDDYERLELSIFPSVDNAFMGWGFLETGGVFQDEKYSAFYLNFDVIAHEIGHGIIYSEVGMPSQDQDNAEYFGFHESAADLVALIASLHFDSVANKLLDNTSGNLYTFNRLSRFAETSDNDQIRLAANDVRLSDFVDGWDGEHKLSQPLTGAMFDILVDVFHENLLDEGLVSPEMEDLSDKLEGDDQYTEIMQSKFDKFYEQNPQGFKEALLLARDYLGTYLADAWRLLDSETLSYHGVGEALQKVDQFISGGKYSHIIANNFRMRDIGLVKPGPRLAKASENSHVFSDRTITPYNL